MEDDREREELVDLLVQRLQAEGAPQGIWLVEIAQVREALRRADQLLRRLSEAIVEQTSG